MILCYCGNMMNGTQQKLPLMFRLSEKCNVSSVISKFGVNSTTTFPIELSNFRISNIQFVSQVNNVFNFKFTGDIGSEDVSITYPSSATIPSVDFALIGDTKINKGQLADVDIKGDFTIQLGNLIAVSLMINGEKKSFSKIKFVKKDGTSKIYTSVKLVKKVHKNENVIF